MKYLLSIDLLGKRKYYLLKEGQEERISDLIQKGKLPPHFKLNGQVVVSSEILGFTNEKKDTTTEGIRSMDELREWAKSQPWYKQKQPKPYAKAQAVPITLLP